jgi:transposase
VAPRLRCPECGSGNAWLLKDGRRRCVRCRFDWKPGRFPLRLKPRQWRALLQWFVRGLPSARIAHETSLDRKRVLRALTVVRLAMVRSVPADVRRAADTETSPVSRGARHRAPSAAPRRSTDASRPRRRYATLGLYAAHRRVWAEVIPDADAEQLERLLREWKARRPVASPGLQRYTADVSRGRLHRLAEPAADRPSVPFGQVEAFWAYLQRQLRAKGGVRRERLGLYLAEFAWRYNHRQLSPAEQVRELLALIR